MSDAPRKFELLDELADFAERHPQARSAFLCRDAKAEIDRLTRELKELDPDPVVCGCREANCPHTPIARLPRQQLVDHYKGRIRELTRELEIQRQGQNAITNGLCEQRDRLRAFVTKLANPDYSRVSSPLGPLHAAGMCSEAKIIAELAAKVLKGET